MPRIRQQYPQNYGASGNISTEFENLIRYLNAAELGNKTIGELLATIFDEDGNFDGPVEMRRDLGGDIQFRIGEYEDANDGWTSLVAASELRGTPGLVVGEIGEPVLYGRYDVTATAGQTNVTYSFENTDALLVYVDGILQVEGASYDYTLDALTNTITFTAALVGGETVSVYKVRRGAISGYTRVDTETAVTQAVFPFVHDEDTKLIVYLNGILQREGGGYDYVTSPETDVVTFNSAVAPGNTVTILTVENTTAQSVTGLMLEEAFVDFETGLIRIDRVRLDDDAIPQSKIAGLPAELGAKPTLVVSGSTPADPEIGWLWLDISSTPNQLRFFDGVQWLRTAPGSLLPSFTQANAGNLLHVNGTGTALEFRPVDLSAVIPKSEKGAQNGVASLDTSARLPKAQLPQLIGSDTIYWKDAGPSAGTYTVKRYFKQRVQLTGLAVQTGGGTASVQIAINGVATGAVYNASTTPNEITFGSPIDVDATSSSVSVDVIVSAPNALVDLEVAIALTETST